MILGILVVVTMVPILMIVIASFTEEKTLLRDGYSLLPGALSVDAYIYMVKQGAIIVRAYGVSILVTFVGTLGSVLITAMLAYPMSRKAFKYRGILTFFVFFTMLFSGGIVPSYIMWTRVFQIEDTIWALILPNYLVTAFNVFLVKNYYTNSIPDSLIEAAQIDGAGEMKIFWKVMLPLSVPTIATVSLFSGLAYWNDWINGLYYINDAKLYSIQILLLKMHEQYQRLEAEYGKPDGDRRCQPSGNIYPYGNGGDRNFAHFAHLSLCAEIFHQGCSSGGSERINIK
ncbi:carbohydrate ABC transporter permease [Blautia sp. RD014234]|nr:carbohydrate ABC transporter permease [Blautia parvula]